MSRKTVTAATKLTETHREKKVQITQRIQKEARMDKLEEDGHELQ